MALTLTMAGLASDHVSNDQIIRLLCSLIKRGKW
jgi:hypothetical protein